MESTVEVDGSGAEQPLSNEDFRKLITDRKEKSGKSEPSESEKHAWKSHKAESGKKATGKPGRHVHKKKPHKTEQDEDEESLNRILRNYRDRAKERREVEEGHPEFPPAEVLQATSGYRAMAPDARSTMDAQERRKRMIQESKYLGGDMEHTHLVKGLDYALLQKVRSEINAKEKDDELETAYNVGKSAGGVAQSDLHDQIKQKVAKGIYRVLFQNDLPKVNELFSPRRMAYVIELDEDFAESDIPTTLLRSKAECPPPESSTNLSSNDMVIQKLTQVLSYLRTDSKKRSKKEKHAGVDRKYNQQDPDFGHAASGKRGKASGIYDDVGDYAPGDRKTGRGGADGRSEKRGSYFERPSEHKDEQRHRDRQRGGGDRDDGYQRGDVGRERGDRGRGGPETAERSRGGNSAADRRLQAGWAPADLSLQRQREEGVNPKALTKEEKDKGMGSVFKRDRDPLASAPTDKEGMKFQDKNPDCYAECYPDAYETYDALGDSDDEADFSRMDLGNKKGLIRRWDFDTEQEYEEYMSQREALPKAAFQYGVKMNDGRRTRKVGGGPKTERDEKMKLDREWQKISKIIDKRRGGGKTEEPHSKKMKS